jgi:hypothetical protein
MTSYVFLPTLGLPKLLKGLGGKILKASNLVIDIESPIHTKLTSEEAVRIINKRLARKDPVISAVFGNPDFLPFPFLELGVRRGAAVCRLVRQFSPRGAVHFLEMLKQAEESLKPRKFEADMLAEILAIDDNKKEEFLQNHQGGTNDLKSEELEELACIPIATGFLVGRSYLLTNCHVFPELIDEYIDEYIAQFGYEQDILGRKIEPVQYRLASLLMCDESLDYALIKLEEQPIDSGNSESMYINQAGDHFGWIRMHEDTEVIAPPLPADISDELLDRLEVPKERAKFGEPVNIIQHPKGRRKEIILSNNRVQQLFDDFLWYEADADFSSSGSPVLNQQWRLVGLHHAAIAEQKNASGEFTVVRQEGVRVHRIVQDLEYKANQLNAKARADAEAEGSFIQKAAAKDERAEEILEFIRGFIRDSSQFQPPPATSY